MKKWLGLFLILISCLFVGNSTIFSQAQETVNELEISTLYPNNVLYYKDLTNIKNISVNDIYIAYNTSENTLFILNKNTRNLINIENYNKIIEIKFVTQNQLVIIGRKNNQDIIQLITLDNNDNVSETILDSISLNALKYELVDIYSKNNKILIGFIKENTTGNDYFELFEIEIIGDTPNTPVKRDTYTSEQFNSAKNLVITDTKIFVVFNNSDNQPRLLTRTYGANTVTVSDIIANIQKLDYYNYNSNEYLVAFTLENLRLISLNDVDITTSITQLNISDIDIFENQIYIADTVEKAINSYIITTDKNENTIFKKDNVLISSSNNSLGRFNSVNDIYTQGNTLYVSDTKNNRIQIINDNNILTIEDLQVDTQPHSIQIDTYRNVYFVEKTSTTTSNIAKYTTNNENYQRTATYSTYNLTNLGFVSDTTITNNDELYILDYTNNKLLSLNNDTGLQPKFTFSFELTESSKIEYIKSQNLLAILNNNIIYLVDIAKLSTESNPIVDSLAMTNCADFTAGLNSIIVLSNNQIISRNINNNTIQEPIKTLENDDFMQFSTIEYNIATNQIFAFDTTTQSIKYFNYSLDSEAFAFENILTNNTPLSTNNAPFAITILNDAIIYDLPYNIGNQHTNITHCIGLELYNETYYRVLFNNNNTLGIGFIDKSNAQISVYNTTNKLSVITTNLKVPVYKYPTILKNNEQAIINEYIPINTKIIISNKCFPITIDGKMFYTYENNGKIGYIFNADVILNDNSNITNLYNNNASIKAIGEDKINIYAEDKTTILATISSDSRISVESYDKHSDYTLVHYKTTDLTTITGYIKTDYVKMDKLDNSRIILIIIIIISVIILTIITISYFIIKKKKN